MSTCPVCEGHGSYAKVDGPPLRPLVFVTCRSCGGSGEIDEEAGP